MPKFAPPGCALPGLSKWPSLKAPHCVSNKLETRAAPSHHDNFRMRLVKQQPCSSITANPPTTDARRRLYGTLSEPTGQASLARSDCERPPLAVNSLDGQLHPHRSLQKMGRPSRRVTPRAATALEQGGKIFGQRTCLDVYRLPAILVGYNFGYQSGTISVIKWSGTISVIKWIVRCELLFAASCCVLGVSVRCGRNEAHIYLYIR
jgi:hypothetical protein